MVMKIARTMVLAACAAAVFACQKDQAGKTTTTGASEQPVTGSVQAMPVRYMSATARITGARCDRQLTCNQVGPDKRFPTRDICTQDEGKKTTDELKSTDCPNGYDEMKLQSCIDAIAKQDCTKLIMSTQTIDACRSAELCVSTSP
jgi:hypothetical protein